MPPGDPFAEINERSRQAAIARSWRVENGRLRRVEPESDPGTSLETLVSIPTGGIDAETDTERRSRGLTYALGALTLGALFVILGLATGLFAAGRDPLVLLVALFAVVGIYVAYDVLLNVGRSDVG